LWHPFARSFPSRAAVTLFMIPVLSPRLFRKFVSFAAFSALAITTGLSAAEPLVTASLPAPRRAPVFSQIAQTRDEARRAMAVALVRSEGDAIKPDYRRVVEPIAAQQRDVLRKMVTALKLTDPSITELHKDYTEWKTACDAAREIVKTDLHKDAKLNGEMDKAYAKTERAFQTLLRKLKSSPNVWALLGTARHVAELERELAWCDGKSSGPGDIALSTVCTAAGASPEVLKYITEMEPLIVRRELNERYAALHSLMRWAKPEQTAYAALLNGRREILGLRPFILAQKLSDAAAQHSEEMVKLKYFAHESPVEANKGPGNRVSNAGFPGGFAGECIYSGGGSPGDAQFGWWHSDGHRFILYADGPQAQGIAKFGTGMWTFLTGNYNTFPM
jgi:uncharacterized protein YkwD